MKSVIAWLRRQPVAVGAVVQLGVLIGCRLYGATAHDTVYAVAVALTIVSAVVHQQVTPNPTITAISGSLVTLKVAQPPKVVLAEEEVAKIAVAVAKALGTTSGLPAEAAMLAGIQQQPTPGAPAGS